jgi:hypothetical protein
MWECVEGFCDEIVGTWMVRTTRCYDQTIRLSQKALLHTRSESDPTEVVEIATQVAIERECFEDFPIWERLIEEYRRRDLTRPNDRVIALSGVAQAFQAKHNLTYLAGMWKEHLPMSLLWHVLPMLKAGEEVLSLPLRESPLDFVPTWSWFASSTYSRNDVIYITEKIPTRYRSLFLSRLLHFRWPEQAVNYAPPTSHYDFVGLQITLELATLTTTLSTWSRPDSAIPLLRCESLEAQLAFLLRVSRNQVEASCICEDLKNMQRPPDTIHIALVAERGNTDDRLHYFRGLALAPGAKKGIWKRMGVWRAWAKSEVSSASRDERLSNFDEKDLTSAEGINNKHHSAFKWGEESAFLRLEGAKIETLTLV